MARRGIVLYLHVHQPWRVREYSVFDTAHNHNYFDQQDQSERDNRQVFKKVVKKSYEPMNALLEKLLSEHQDFRLSLSITGTFIEQAEKWSPEILESFKRLVATGKVEIVAETYYHSLAFFYSHHEFEEQVKKHQEKIRELFGVETRVLRNTELAYNDELGTWADAHGFKGVLGEGWDPILEWRNSNHVYSVAGADSAKLLLKNYRLSDDIAFRFSDKKWKDWPLTVQKYERWLEDSFHDGKIINLFMDYETFGEHQWADTGIFDFFSKLVSTWLKDRGRTFYTVSEALDTFPSAGEISIPHTVTWADTERDLSAWLGNSMQQEALRHLYDLEESVMLTNDEPLISDWRNLQTSDHVYYMCTKWFADGDVHAYFSPYNSPYEAFMFYMNVLRDIRYRVMEHHKHGGLYGASYRS